MTRAIVRRTALLATAVAFVLAACSSGATSAPTGSGAAPGGSSAGSPSPAAASPSGEPYGSAAGSAAQSASAGSSGAASATPAASAAGSAAPSGAAASAGPSATACPTTAPAPWTAADTATVTLKTAKGDIAIKVEGGIAPNATANFVALAGCGFYNGVVFHRLVPGFVIQGGDGQFGREPNVDLSQIGTGGPGYTIADDGVFNDYPVGTVAMARTSQPHSQGSQFFIVLSAEANASLVQAGSYAIVGHVTSGMDAVQAIASMPNSGGQSNLAVQPVPIDAATVSHP